jgi:hypothetical protein
MPYNDANTVLYLPLDTDWNDQSVGHTVVHTPTIQMRPNLTASGATIDGVTKKFGAGSAKFVRASSQYLYTGDLIGTTYVSSKRWAFGTDPFTIGFWYNFTAHVADYCPIGQCIDVNNRWIVYINQAGANHYVQFYAIYGAAAKANYQFNFTPNDGQWYWIEIARNGANFYMSIDGIMQALTVGTAINGNSLTDLNIRLAIGRQDLAGSNAYCDGHIDDLFVDKGRALHTADFTPPASAGASNHPDYTVLYQNFDADFLDRGAYNDMIDSNIKKTGAGSGRINIDYYQNVSYPASADFDVVTDMAVEADIYLNSLPPLNETYRYITQIGGAANGTYFFLAVWNDAGTYKIQMEKAIAGTGVVWTLSGTMYECNINTWYRIMFIRNGHNGYLYQNYRLISTALGTLLDNSLIHDNLVIGRSAPSTTTPNTWHNFDGHVDNISYSIISRLPYNSYTRKVNYTRRKTLIGR